MSRGAADGRVDAMMHVNCLCKRRMSNVIVTISILSLLESPVCSKLAMFCTGANFKYGYSVSGAVIGKIYTQGHVSSRTSTKATVRRAICQDIAISSQFLMTINYWRKNLNDQMDVVKLT